MWHGLRYFRHMWFYSREFYLTYMQTGRRTHLLLFLVSNFPISLSQQSTCIKQLETIYEFYFRWNWEVYWKLTTLVLPCISMVPEIIILTSWYMTLKLDSFSVELYYERLNILQNDTMLFEMDTIHNQNRFTKITWIIHSLT